MKYFERQGEPSLSLSHKSHIERMVTDGSNFAYINDVSSSRLIAGKHECQVAIMPENFFSLKYCIGMQNNSAYRDAINNV